LNNTITIRSQLYEQTKDDGVCVLCKTELNQKEEIETLKTCYGKDLKKFKNILENQKLKEVDVNTAIETISNIYNSLDSDNINKIITDVKEKITLTEKEKQNLQVV